MAPPVNKKAKNEETKGSTADLCPALRKCVERWGLTAPYSSPDDDEKWGAYTKPNALALSFVTLTFGRKKEMNVRNLKLAMVGRRSVMMHES